MQGSLHQILDIHYISVIKTYCKDPVLVYNNRFIHRLKAGLPRQYMWTLKTYAALFPFTLVTERRKDKRKHKEIVREKKHKLYPFPFFSCACVYDGVYLCIAPRFHTRTIYMSSAYACVYPCF